MLRNSIMKIYSFFYNDYNDLMTLIANLNTGNFGLKKFFFHLFKLT